MKYFSKLKIQISGNPVHCGAVHIDSLSLSSLKHIDKRAICHSHNTDSYHDRIYGKHCEYRLSGGSGEACLPEWSAPSCWWAPEQPWQWRFQRRRCRAETRELSGRPSCTARSGATPGPWIPELNKTFIIRTGNHNSWEIQFLSESCLILVLLFALYLSMHILKIYVWKHKKSL